MQPNEPNEPNETRSETRDRSAVSTPAGGRAVLCGCLVDTPVEQLPVVLNHPELDMVEWRLDRFAVPNGLAKTIDALNLLRSGPRLPVLATNRPKGQGGVFEGAESVRIAVLHQAVEAGAEWVDLEWDVPDEALESFRTSGARLLLSCHDFSGTPDSDSLKRLLELMAGRGTDVVKIVTTAFAPDDPLRVLDLISFGKREFGIDVIAFCMDAAGRWSRVVSLLLGSPWAYVQMPGQSGSAPGQFTASEFRELWERMA